VVQTKVIKSNNLEKLSEEFNAFVKTINGKLLNYFFCQVPPTFFLVYEDDTIAGYGEGSGREPDKPLTVH